MRFAGIENLELFSRKVIINFSNEALISVMLHLAQQQKLLKKIFHWCCNSSSGSNVNNDLMKVCRWEYDNISKVVKIEKK